MVTFGRGDRIGRWPNIWPSVLFMRVGFPVRLSGQDCERGTFSQRHSVIIDQGPSAGTRRCGHIAGQSGALRSHQFDALGRSRARLRIRLLARGANDACRMGSAVRRFRQRRAGGVRSVHSSGERKWLRMSGLVCLLPHGYEGQGPEHSSPVSSDICSFCAEDNWQVCNCTTPSNYFHVLRRQLHRKFRSAHFS